jgi:hypothetical protein
VVRRVNVVALEAIDWIKNLCHELSGLLVIDQRKVTIFIGSVTICDFPLPGWNIDKVYCDGI